MDKTILVVDDDKKIAELVSFRLKKLGYATHRVYGGKDAIAYAERHQPGLVMLDIRLPDINGVEVLEQLRKVNSACRVIMISAHGDVKTAVECMKLGAYDFIEKPIAFPEFDAKVKHALDHFRLEEEVSHLKKELGEKYKTKSLIGKSRAMKKVLECIGVAEKSDVNVLIQGESGTGKELVARAIHFNGIQKHSPFIAVNCGAIPENLLESELFGHEKGAFTGALSRKIGKFEQAQGGTIFLDEIGDLSATMQVKLLRVLQEHEIERVGGNQPVTIQARFITATHQDLKRLVADGKFREDLYFRINVFPVQIPPLREHREDIPELLKYFMKKFHRQKQNIQFDGSALKLLTEYQWPGNIRELENLVERLALVTGDNGVITAENILSLDALNHKMKTPEVPKLTQEYKAIGDAEKTLFENALRETNGNVSKASKLLHVSRDTFYRKMKKHFPVQQEISS